MSTPRNPALRTFPSDPKEDTALSRLTYELRNSPVKAVVLGVGILVALLVWVPRFVTRSSDAGSQTTSTTKDPASNASPSSSSALAGFVANLADGSSRDSFAMRTEFMRISQEAQQLHRFADGIEPRASSRDPFARIATKKPPSVAPDPPPQSEDTSETPALLESDAERARVALLRIDGIVRFATHSQCFLGGMRHEVGETIDGGLTIETIEERAVVLKGKYGTYRLEMHHGDKESHR